MSSLSGIITFARGCFSAFKYPSLAVKCVLLSAIFLLAWTFAVWFGTDVLIHNWFGDSYDELFWDGILRYGTWITLLAVGLAATPIVVSTMMMLIAPSIRGELFDRVVRTCQQRRDNDSLHPQLAQPLSLAQAVRIDLYRIAYALGGSMLIGLIGFFLGIQVWGLVQFTFTLWCVGVDTIGLDHERRGRNRKLQDQINKQQRTLIFGIGLITFMLYAIPILQLAGPMLVTAGAAHLSVWKETNEATA